MGLFGKSNHEEAAKKRMNEWSRKLRQENHAIDRSIRGIQRSEMQAKRTMKEAAKKGDKDACKILAKEVVHSRKAVNRMYASKAQIDSVIMQMRNQFAVMRTVGSIQKSTEIMRSMQRLVRIPEISKTMQELSKEMMKAGIIEEMFEDTMDVLDEDAEETEAAADAEVDKVLFELTEGKLGQAPEAIKDDLGQSTTAAKTSVQQPQMQDLEEQLEALRT